MAETTRREVVIRPRPWFPGTWVPSMAEQGLSVWLVLLDFRDLSCFAYLQKEIEDEYQPEEPKAHWTDDPMVTRDTWYSAEVIAKDPREAIEAAQAHVVYHHLWGRL